MSAGPFDRLAAGWDAAHGPASPGGAGFAARVACLRRLCRAQGRPRVLDVGCGTGMHLLHLAGEIRAGLGIDLSPAMIARARANAEACLGGAPAHVEFRVGDALAICASHETFDLVLFLGVLEHVADQPAALAAARAALAPGGRIVVVMPKPPDAAARARLHAELADPAVPVAHLDRDALAALAARCGLRLASAETLPQGHDPSGAYAAELAPA